MHAWEAASAHCGRDIELYERCNEAKVAKVVRSLAEAAPKLQFFAFATEDIASSHWAWKIHRTAEGVVRVTDRVVKLQTGYMYHYAFAMLIGVAAILTWLTYNGLFGGVLK